MQKLMPNAPTLISKKGKWYVQLTIPKELRHLYPNQKQKQRSTGTTDKTIANKKAHVIASEIYADFESKAMQSPWDNFVKELVLEDIEYWDMRYIGDQPFSITYKKRPIDADEAAAALKTAHFRLMEWDLISERNGWLKYAIDNDLLWVDMQKARQSLADVAVQLKTDFPEMDMSHAFGETKISTPKPRPTILLQEDQSPLFSILIDGYLKSKPDNRRSEIKLACERAISYIGDKPVNEYDRVDGIEVAEKMDARGFSYKRIKTTISLIKGVFVYAGSIRGENGKVVLERPPWTNLQLAKYGIKPRPYEPFSKDELNWLFQEPMLKQERLLLSILTTTGMRLDEAALMTWERVVDYQGIRCFSLLPSTENEQVRVKNDGSKRYIPVPDIIKPLLKARCKGRIFDYRTHNGKAQAKASDALMPIIRKVTQNDRKVVHSLRGNFKDSVREAGYSKEINDFLTGHKQGDVAGGYGHGPSMEKRLEVLNAIQHPYLEGHVS